MPALTFAVSQLYVAVHTCSNRVRQVRAQTLLARHTVCTARHLVKSESKVEVLVEWHLPVSLTAASTRGSNGRRFMIVVVRAPLTTTNLLMPARQLDPVLVHVCARLNACEYPVLYSMASRPW
jgi:hypothetical protein